MEVSSRYLIGIDLGTTNSAVAYIDRQAAPQKNGTPLIHVFDVPQFVAEGELGTLSGLPSFLYFIDATESTTDSFRLPWDAGPPSIVVGALAREQGALVPGRQVTSAKSWLSLSSVDRTADILPWGAEQPEHSCSPVAASARYLAHLRDAWNYVMASSNEGGDKADAVDERRFEQQVLADGRPREPHIFAVDADADQAEVGRAAADITNQNQLAVFEVSLECCAMSGNPGVERGQRFFQ